MASKPSPTFELLQLLNVLGVQIDNDDSLSRLSPSFLESQVQTYLSYTQQSDKLATSSKIEIKEVKDVKGADLKAYGSAQIHGGGHHHGHSHGEDDHGHGHSHSHGGGAGHGHGHSHGGHSHGGSGGGGAHGHGHTHGGQPCTGHGDEDEEEEEEEEEACNSDHDHDHDHDHDDDDDGDTTNQVLLALRHYMSILTQGIQQAWSKPPLFPGAPKANTWVLREQSNTTSSQNQGHDLLLTIAGLTTLSTSGEEETPAILLHYTLDSPAARKGLWGDIMQLPLPREILHLLRLLLDFNSRKCPSFKPYSGAHVGALSGATGFKQSFIVPVSEKNLGEDQVGKLDLRKDGLGKLVGCDVCGLLGPDLKCAKCKKRTYCSGGCQRKDWKEHKNTCGK